MWLKMVTGITVLTTIVRSTKPSSTLYVPPTPAELIPTLKEHEWVRLTTTYNEKPFEGTVFFAHGAIMVGLNILAPNDSPPNPSITSIERCDPPEVK